ncbi:hypothetical protein A2U01_0093875, partial [Trifolium medium]|nr:hypothetical protein [Trifolium medium]
QVEENQYKKKMVVEQGKKLGLMGDGDDVGGVFCEYDPKQENQYGKKMVVE